MTYTFSKLFRQYQDRIVLDLPALTLDRQCRYALIGENGAGKSTLLSLLTEAFQSLLPAWQIGFLPQKPYPFAISVRESLALGIPQHAGLLRDEQNKLLDSQLRTFDLLHLAHKRADRLSGGESQRLAIARLLIIPRQVLLLDEPGNHIDRDRQGLIFQLLGEYLAKNSCLLIMTTHAASGLELTDEVLTLDQGRLTFRESTSDYHARMNSLPQGEFTC